MQRNVMLGLAVALCMGSGPVARAQSAAGDSVIVARSRAQAPLVPDVSAVDLAGRTWSLRALRGRPVILSLFATWCPYCREEMDELNALQRKFGPSGLVILAVSEEDTATLAGYASSNRDSVPLLSGSDVIASLRTGSYPTTYFIGRDSRILARTKGFSLDYTRLLARLVRNELGTPATARQSAKSAQNSRANSLAPRQPARESSSQLRSQASLAIRSANRSARNAAKKKGRGSKQKPASDDGVLMLSNSGSRILR